MSRFRWPWPTRLVVNTEDDTPTVTPVNGVSQLRGLNDSVVYIDDTNIATLDASSITPGEITYVPQGRYGTAVQLPNGSEVNLDYYQAHREHLQSAQQAQAEATRRDYSSYSYQVQYNSIQAGASLTYGILNNMFGEQIFSSLKPKVRKNNKPDWF